MHRTDLFVVNGADLEYTKKILLQFHGEQCCIGVVLCILKITEIKDRWKNQSPQWESQLDYQIKYFLNGIIQIIIQVYVFSRWKKCIVFPAPNIMIGTTIHAIAPGVILNLNILHENIPTHFIVGPLISHYKTYIFFYRNLHNLYNWFILATFINESNFKDECEHLWRCFFTSSLKSLR